MPGKTHSRPGATLEQGRTMPATRARILRLEREVSSPSIARRWWLSGLALVVLGLCASCQEADAPEIRIGLLATLNGVPRETSGIPSLNGASMAIESVNAAGGIELEGVRHHVRLVVKNYEDRPDSATSEARSLINRERIHAIVGPQFSRHAIPVSLVAEEARIPMISPMASNPATTEEKQYVFRLAFLDDVQGQVMGRFAFEELGARKAAVLYDVTTAYGRQLAQVFCEAFESEGGRIVARESYARDAPLEYSEQIETIRISDPDVLYLPNDTVFVEAQIRQAREAGIQSTVLGGDTWDVQHLRTLRESDGSYIAHQWHYQLDTPEAREFLEHYRNEYGTLPKVTAAMTFDAVGVLLRAIEEAGSTNPDAIRDAIANAPVYAGATGVIRYQGSPDPVRSVVISRILDGQSALFKVVDP